MTETTPSSTAWRAQSEAPLGVAWSSHAMTSIGCPASQLLFDRLRGRLRRRRDLGRALDPPGDFDRRNDHQLQRVARATGRRSRAGRADADARDADGQHRHREHDAPGASHLVNCSSPTFPQSRRCVLERDRCRDENPPGRNRARRRLARRETIIVSSLATSQRPARRIVARRPASQNDLRLVDFHRRRDIR